MIELLSETTQRARKEYGCDASEFLYANCLSDLDGITFTEKKAIANARRNNWKIKPGEEYFKQISKYDGEFCMFRAIPAIDEICRKYDLYRE